MIIPLPWPKPPLTSNRQRGNEYARAAEVKRARTEAAWVIRAANIPAFPGPVEVTLHYRIKDRRRRDTDGIYPTLKACLDAGTDAGLWADDSWQHVPVTTCRIHPPDGPPGMWLTVDAHY